MAELKSAHNYYVIAQQWNACNIDEVWLFDLVKKPLWVVQLDHTSLILSGKRSTVFLPSSYYCYLPPTSLKRLPFWTKTGLSVIPYTDVLPPGEPAELNNVLRFVSLILSLISPKSSWQGSCQAISGNKNSLHTSLLIFPLLCLLLKCFFPPSLEETALQLLETCSPSSLPPGPEGPADVPKRWGKTGQRSTSFSAVL